MRELSKLGRKIFLDRYAAKDPNKYPNLGDTVLYTDPQTKQKEVGVVSGVSGTTNGDGLMTKVDVFDEATSKQHTFHLSELDMPVEDVHDTMARVAKAAAKHNLDDEKKFLGLLTSGSFIPAGRILESLGAKHQTTGMNCFSGETQVTTKELGTVRIDSLVGDYHVWSVGGVWRKATFASYGKQPLLKVTLENGQVIHATAKHEWIVSSDHNLAYACDPKHRVTTDRLEGKRVYLNPTLRPERGADWDRGVAHGVVYGDGTRSKTAHTHVDLFGEKRELASRLAGTQRVMEHSRCGATTRVTKLPAYFKTMPSPTESPEYWAGFVSGLIATDGHVDRRGHVMLHNTDKEFLGYLQRNLIGTGMVSGPIRMSRYLSPFTGQVAPCYKLTLLRTSIHADDLLRSQHKANWLRAKPVRPNATLRVVSVEATDRVEEVYCCVEPETHTITVDGGVLTGQCFVLPSPKDNRAGIFSTLERMAELMCKGGGVGINYSSLRPENAYVSGVNGRSSGAVSWLELFSYVTNLIIQGGCLPGDALLDTDKGKISAADLADRLDAGEQISAHTHLGYRPFTAVFRNGIKPMVKLGFDYGKPIVVSTDHKMAVNTINNPEWMMWDLKPARELVVGDILRTGDPDTDVSDLEILDLGKIVLKTIEPAGEAEAYDFEVEEAHMLCADGIYSSNSRRGAQMAMLADWHPDIFKFVDLKRDNNRATGCNMSVVVSDAFMSAVHTGEKWDLKFPDTSHPQYDELWDGDIEAWVEKGLPVKVWQTIPARDLWDRIIASAHACAEPGLWFRDRANAYRPFGDKLTATNPCCSGDTSVLTVSGPKAFADLAETEEDVQVWGFDKDTGTARIAWMRRPHMTAEDVEVVTLVFSTGAKQRFTPNHHLFFSDDNGETHKKVQVQYIKAGDKLLTACSAGSKGSVEVTHVYRDNSKINVYNGMVEDIHTYLIDNDAEQFLVSANCGEQGLPGYGVCNLGHLVLPNFVTKNTWDLDFYDPISYVDWDRLADAVVNAVKFLNNVIDVTNYPLEETKQQQQYERRIGLGTVGLGEMLIRLGIRYGSAEACKFVDELYSYIAYKAYGTSVKLAKKDGPAPAWMDAHNDEGEWVGRNWFNENSKFAQHLSQHFYRVETGLCAQIQEHGLRNACLLTQAPTGTVGTMLNTSTGIEPYYALRWQRSSRLGVHTEVAKVVEDYRRDTRTSDSDSLPSYFVTAMDLIPSEHVDMQAAIQKWTDASISKTINCPENWTVKQIGEIYHQLYNSGCKGGTVYRDNCRSVQVLSSLPATPTTEPEPVVVKSTCPTCPDSDITFTIETTPEPYPEVRPSVTSSKQTPGGTIHVHITYCPTTKQPLEVFCDAGKSGSEVGALMEAMGRVITLALRPRHQDPSQRLCDIIEQLQGIGGNNSIGFGPSKVMSMPDGIARALLVAREYREAPGLPIDHPIAKHVSGFDVCPGCQNVSLQRASGCENCAMCGYSRC